MRFGKIFILLVMLSSCATNRDNDSFYYSYSHHTWEKEVGAGRLPTVNGITYTCWCKPKYVKKYYKKRFSDAQIVFRGKSGTYKIVPGK